MQVFVITYSGDMGDEPAVLAVCATLELAIARAEARAQEALDEEPELAMAGWYYNTVEMEEAYFVGLFDEKETCTDAWYISEETVESQS